MASKITKQDVRGCLSAAVLPRDCHNITLNYPYYSQQKGQEMWLLWERQYYSKNYGNLTEYLFNCNAQQ